MELLFNELSTTPLSEDKFSADAKMKLFSETIAEARKKGFKRIRSDVNSHEIELSKDYSLYDYLNTKAVPEIYRNNLFGMFVRPFIKDGDEEHETAFIGADYYYENKETNFKRTDCLGLAAAHIYETLSVSLQSSTEWTKNELTIIVTVENEETEEKIANVFSKNCFNNHAIAHLVENMGDLVLTESEIIPNNKKLHLTSHHGQKELQELWNRLKNSPYVEEALSIEWGGKSFFKNPKKNGKLEIVHLKSDRRYVLQIQTTGKNLRETLAIAKKLEEDYS